MTLVLIGVFICGVGIGVFAAGFFAASSYNKGEADGYEQGKRDGFALGRELID